MGIPLKPRVIEARVGKSLAVGGETLAEPLDGGLGVT